MGISGTWATGSAFFLSGSRRYTVCFVGIDEVDGTGFVGRESRCVAEAGGHAIEGCAGHKHGWQGQRRARFQIGPESKMHEVMRANLNAADLVENAVIESQPRLAEDLHVVEVDVFGIMQRRPHTAWA